MTVTLSTLIYQPGKTRDVEVGQMFGVVMAGPRKPAYPDDYVLQIAVRWAHWADKFGFLRSVTWGQGPGHETGWFWSRAEVNQVHPDQHNWGGLGADNSGAAGGTFGPIDGLSAIDHGILAFMCHLSLYVHGEPDKWPAHTRQYAKYAYRLNDVRWAHNNVEKPDRTLLRHFATVKTIGDFLNGRWARTDDPLKPLGTLANGYARGIVAKANETRAMPLDPSMEGPPVNAPISNLKDIRHRLTTSAASPRGPLRTVPTSRKNGGVVIHFRGVNTTPAPGYDSFAADATYHVNRNWAKAGDPVIYGDGIMYHIGIGWDSVKYWMRDLDRVLWHCGEPRRNESTLSVQVPMGAGQRATPKMIQALKEVCDEWHAARGTTPLQTWGHSEVTPTSCPGTLLEDFVRPYRAGTLGLAKPQQERIPGALYIPANPYGEIPIQAGFQDFFLRVGRANFELDPIAGAVAVFGFAIGAEYPTEFGSAQEFERVILKWFRGAQRPWDIVPALRTESIPERLAA